MIVAARVVCDAPLVITQGCYNAGGVAASAGTHDGGGAVDIRARDLSDAQIAEAVLKLRHVGFAAWHRLPSQGPWVEHIHCIAIGCPDLSSGAAYQVTAYKEGLNGLANRGKDDGPRTYVDWTWEKYKAAFPDLLTEDTLSAQDVQDIKDFVEARLKAYIGWDAKNLTQQLGTAQDAEAATEAAQYSSVVAEIRATQKIATDAVAALATKVDALTAKVDALPKA